MVPTCLIPTKFLGLDVENRVGRSAVAMKLCEEDGTINEGTVDHYRALARGRVGFIIVEHSFVHPRGHAHTRQISISRDSDIEGHRHLIQVMKAENPNLKVALQLAHAGAAAEPFESEAAGPSTGVEIGEYNSKCHEFTKEELYNEVIPAFAAAARRAEQAGYDAVQIHMAHGYLLSEFLSPSLNRRTDEFGTDLTLLPKLVYEAIRGATKIPVFAKIGIDHLPTRATGEVLGKEVVSLARAGLMGFEISGGTGVSPAEYRPIRLKESNLPFYNRDGYEAARSALDDAGFSACEVAVVGGFQTLEDVEAALSIPEPPALVFLARQLMRHPETVSEWYQENGNKA